MGVLKVKKTLKWKLTFCW